MIDDDLKTILDDMVVWRKNYLNKYNEVIELNSQIDILQNELRISRDAEKRIKLQLNRKQENIIQLQDVLSKFSEEQEKSIKLCEEKELLKKEVEKIDKKYKEEKQTWEKEKLDLIENHEKELQYVKDTGHQEAYSLQMDINRMNETNSNTIQCLKNEIIKKENDYKRSISQTISNYEEELSKLNGDLAKAQNEIKMLRERCAARVNIYRNVNNMEIGKYVIDQNESNPNYSKIRFEPIPIVTAHSQLCIDTAETSLKSQQFDNTSSEQELVRKPKIAIRKTLTSKSPTRKTASSKSPIRKRKLYSHNDDFL